MKQLYQLNRCTLTLTGSHISAFRSELTMSFPLNRLISAEEIKAVELARADWVPACEAALDLRGVSDFLQWMDRFVRPLLKYQVMLCGTGVFLARAVNADRLLLRGIRASECDRLRDEFGTVVLPRGTMAQAHALQPVDLAALTMRAWARRPPGAIALLHGQTMERHSGTRQRGSYFLFGVPDDAPPQQSDYGMRLLAPQMHDALLNALATEREGVDQRAPVHLTRTERQLLEFLVAGRTTPDIARETFRSVHTVANQMQGILRKLKANTRTEAISKALGLGLVTPVDRAPHTRIIAAQPKATYRVCRTGTWKGVYLPLQNQSKARWIIRSPT